MTLKEIRKAKGMTQDDVAQGAGISRSAYANIEIGHRSPSVAMARRIAKVLGVSWIILFEEEAENDAD